MKLHIILKCFPSFSFLITFNPFIEDQQKFGEFIGFPQLSSHFECWEKNKTVPTALSRDRLHRLRSPATDRNLLPEWVPPPNLKRMARSILGRPTVAGLGGARVAGCYQGNWKRLAVIRGLKPLSSRGWDAQRSFGMSEKGMRAFLREDCPIRFSSRAPRREHLPWGRGSRPPALAPCCESVAQWLPSLL